jgi:hypothetical protein
MKPVERYRIAQAAEKAEHEFIWLSQKLAYKRRKMVEKLARIDGQIESIRIIHELYRSVIQAGWCGVEPEA